MHISTTSSWGFLGDVTAKEPTYQCRRCKRCRFHPWVRKIPWRRKWQPTPVFSPGESHGQSNLWATVHGVTMSQTRQKQLSMGSCTKSIFYRQTFRLLPCLGYCKLCCNEHWGACILSDHLFLRIYAQEWDCRVTW